MIKCDCDERIGIEINSVKVFNELKDFFEKQQELGVFVEVPVKKPHYQSNDILGNTINWYANKWYKCRCCGTLWEFDYPEFPASGFVRKFENGYILH